ncbi:hypothetical protein MC885_007761 [Smutsia gigantea]|nr:hypothetical protein MC885_007761 [Smutsia gigantea]
MASESHMPAPLCLIENTKGQLVANQEALKVLSAVTQPVVVVAIVGLYRTGKSYLMNKLAGKRKGFSVGSTVQSHTKGIWIWCLPHPKKPSHTLVLLDTEGLGDVEKGDQNNDTNIFALAILLSSTFVYNTMNKIDQRAIDLLQYPLMVQDGIKARKNSCIHQLCFYVIELSNLLRTITSPDGSRAEDAADFQCFCPDLVWTLRDFYLALEVDGKLITADEYLENSLKPGQGTNQSLQNFNLPHQCIKKFFPVRKCFVFDTPTHRKKFAQLETLCNDELNPDFVQQVEEFYSYILNHSKPKTLSGGIKVNGPYLESLVLTYVNAIGSGNLPCMENAVLALAQIKNSTAVKKAIAHYDQEMSQKVQLPTETLQELLDLHRVSESEAIRVFMKNSFQDVDQSFRKELETLLEAKQNDFCKQNLKASSDYCSALLQDIFQPLEEGVKLGIYSKPGGFRLFMQKTEKLKAMYYQKPGKGIQAEEALQKYLQSRESVSDSILQMDLALTKREKEKEEARVKAEAAEAEVHRLEAIQRHKQEMLAQRERLHQQQVRQAERNRARELAMYRRAQERRLQEEAKNIREHIEAERRQLYNEIQQLQREVRSPEDPCILL